MAIPPNVARIVFSGLMPNNEIWSTGFWVHGAIPDSQATANALAELAFDEFGADDASGGMRTAIETLGNAQTIWNEVRTYVYPAGGPHAQYIGAYTLPTPVVGGAAGHLPNQIALVATLRTGLAGRANRGRMYLPCTGVPFATDGQIGTPELDAVCASWALGFSDWNAASTPKVVVVSSSQKGNPSYAGRATPVTSVTMDSRADIQRSRANSETILRTTSGVVTGGS